MLQPKREELGIGAPLERFEKAKRDILRRKLDLRHHAHHQINNGRRWDSTFHSHRDFVASQATARTERVGLRALVFMNRTCSRLPPPTNYTASITGGGVCPQIAGGSLFRAAASAIVCDQKSQNPRGMTTRPPLGGARDCQWPCYPGVVVSRRWRHCYRERWRDTFDLGRHDC
jgi:hypothetical protein